MQAHLIDYRNKLDTVIPIWLGLESNHVNFTGIHYRAFAVAIGDPWMDFATEREYSRELDRHYIVDIENPKVQKLIDLAHGPHGNTILKMIDMGMFNVNESE